MPMTAILPATCLLAAAGGGAYWFGKRERARVAAALLAAGPLLAVVPLLLWLVPAATPPAGAPPSEAIPATSAASTASAATAPTAAPATVPASGSIAPISGARPTGLADAREREAAEQLRVAGKYAEARDAFRRLAQRRPQDADAWADAADCAAAAAAGDLDAGAADLERALAAQPRHPKALWLKASLELQHHRYSSAATLWEQLLAALPPESEDRRVVQANLQEARTLAGMPATTGR